MGNQPIKEDRLNSIDETASELENGNNMYNVCIPNSSNTTRLPIEVKSEKKSNFQNVSTLFHSKKREDTTLFNPSVIEILSEDPLTQKHNLQTYCNIHNTEFTTLRNNPSKWTPQECEALIKAVKKYGTMNKWTDIAESIKYEIISNLVGVGTRTVSQCINKWRNDLSFNGRKQRMTKRAIEQVKQYIKENKSEEEIRTLMPQFSYIQIYQQVRKVQCNTNTFGLVTVE